MKHLSIQGMRYVVAAALMLTSGSMAIRSMSTIAFAQDDSGLQFVHKGNFESQNPIIKGVFGYSSAIDGNTLVVGEPASTSNSDAGVGHGFLHIYTRDGEAFKHLQTVTSDDSTVNDNFGASVSISGDTIVVSSPSHDGAQPDSGAVYVFVKGEDGKYKQQQKLFEQNPNMGDFFGYSVSLSGNTLVVGSTGDGDNDNVPRECGVVYVYVREGNSWNLQAQLWPPDPVERGFLGTWTAIVGDTIVAGASGDDGKSDNAGAVYVWNRTGSAWALSQKITSDDGLANDWFGSAISFDGKEIYVGAPGDDVNNSDQGSIYIFAMKDGKWFQSEKLSAPDGQSADHFGSSIVRNGKYVVIGAPLADASGTNSGAVYVYGRPRGEGTELMIFTKINPIPGSPTDFGKTAALTSDNVLAVGAPGIFDYKGAVVYFAESRLSPPDISRWSGPTFIGGIINIDKPSTSVEVTLGQVVDDITPPGNIKVRVLANPWGISFNSFVNNQGTISANLSVDCSVFNTGPWITDWTNEVWLLLKDGDWNTSIATVKFNVASLQNSCQKIK